MKFFIVSLLVLLVGLFGTACVSSAVDPQHVSVQNLMNELREVSNADDEERILTELWEISYDENSDVRLSASAIDAEGESVITDLSTAVEPVVVTLTLSGENWSETIEFSALDYENLYILLME